MLNKQAFMQGFLKTCQKYGINNPQQINDLIKKSSLPPNWSNAELAELVRIYGPYILPSLTAGIAGYMTGMNTLLGPLPGAAIGGLLGGSLGYIGQQQFGENLPQFYNNIYNYIQGNKNVK